MPLSSSDLQNRRDGYWFKPLSCGKLLWSNRTFTHNLIRQCNMFTESLDFSYCLLSTTHLQSPPLARAATLGRNHLDSSQHLAFPTSQSRRVWRPYGKPRNRQPSLILHAPWGCLRSLWFPGLALSLYLPQEHIHDSAYAFYHEAPGWWNINRKGDHLITY